MPMPSSVQSSTWNLRTTPMSDKQQNDNSSDANQDVAKSDADVTETDAPQSEVEAAEAAEPEPTPEPIADRSSEAATATAPPPAATSKSAGGITWLALLLAVLSAAGAGWLLFNDWRERGGDAQSAAATDNALASLSGRIDGFSDSLTTVDQKLTDLAAADVRTRSDADTANRDIDARVRVLDALPARMGNVEASMAALQGVSAGARDNWLLAESEYYMQIANAQLQLAGNPELAALALGMADERIAKLSNPALTDVRRALANELAALELMQKPDIEGITLTLASLAGVVDSLPLRRPESDASANGESDDEAGGFGRAWNSVKSAASELVKVTPPNAGEMPLIAPDAVYFLRTNLSLNLQIARLALLRGENAVFQQSLDDARSWIERYFDTDSAQVAGALQTIAELRNDAVSVTAPDISRSLRLLRQFETLAETAE